MNRRTLRSSVLLVFLVLTLLSLLHTQVSLTYASPTLEDFALFTETDPNSHITVTNSTYITFKSYKNEDAYLYSDKGTNNFVGDWEHKVDVKYSDPHDSDVVVVFWALTTEVDDLKGLEDASKSVICAYVNYTGAVYELAIRESIGGASYKNSTSINSGTWYYPLLERDDTSFICRIYNNTARTNDYLEYTLSLTLHSIVNYRYVFVAMTYDEGGVAWSEANIRLLDLQYSYEYTLKGAYSETTGLLLTTGVNVTAYFTSQVSNTFLVNGTYPYGSYNMPQYFEFDLTGTRQYWLSSNETTATIYIFDASTTEYTIEFIDIGGVLDKYSFVSAKRFINGTLHIIEKRQADVNNRVIMNLIQGQRYNIVIEDDITYNYGEEYFGTDITVEIIIRGINFPQEVILAYRRVRLYANRHNNYTSISMCYEDLENDTDHVDCRIKYRNGTVAYQTTKYTRLFNETWTSAQYNITYYVEMDAVHNNYGTLNYRAILYRGGFNINPWRIEWLGNIPDMEISTLIPIFLVFAVAGVFSKVNAYVGAFMATIIAILFSWWGWLPIPPAMLIMALVFAILMALAYKKKRMIGV